MALLEKKGRSWSRGWGCDSTWLAHRVAQGCEHVVKGAHVWHRVEQLRISSQAGLQYGEQIGW